MAAIMKHTTLADWIRSDEQKEADQTEVLMDHEVRHEGRIYHKIKYVWAQAGSLAQPASLFRAHPAQRPALLVRAFPAPPDPAPRASSPHTSYTHTRAHMNIYFVPCAALSSY